MYVSFFTKTITKTNRRNLKKLNISLFQFLLFQISNGVSTNPSLLRFLGCAPPPYGIKVCNNKFMLDAPPLL